MAYSCMTYDISYIFHKDFLSECLQLTYLSIYNVNQGSIVSKTSGLDT